MPPAARYEGYAMIAYPFHLLQFSRVYGGRKDLKADLGMCFTRDSLPGLRLFAANISTQARYNSQGLINVDRIACPMQEFFDLLAKACYAYILRWEKI